MSAPHASDHGEETISEILELATDMKAQDAAKIDWVLKRAVDPKLVWTEISKHFDFFSADSK